MPSYTRLLEIVAVASASVLAGCIWLLATKTWSLTLLAETGFVSTVAGCLLVVSLHLRSRRPCDTLKVKEFLLLSLLSVVSATFGRLARRRVLKCQTSRQIREAQEAALMKRLAAARRCKFGKDHGFDQIHSIDEYRRRVPVRQYTDMSEYTELTDRGLPDILYDGPVDFLAKTSGTTGKNKTLPFSNAIKKNMISISIPIIACNEAYKRRIGRPGLLGRMLMIRVMPKDRKNEFGVPIGPVTKFLMSDLDLQTMPPDALKQVHDADTCMLLQCIFALWHERIDYVDAFFPTMALSFMRSLSENFNDVIEAIERGRLPSRVTSRLPQSLTHSLTSRLTPKPERARSLRRLFSNGENFENFFLKAWPEVSFIAVVRGGSFETAYRHLRRRYLGDLPAFCCILGGTEGIQGVNFCLYGVNDAEGDRFLPWLQTSLVEYLPLDKEGRDAGEPVLVHEMQKGVEYEAVMTSPNCWRLRVGDVVEVMEKRGDMPVIRILHRKSHTLTAHVEKTSELSLKQGVIGAAEVIQRQLVGFVAADFAVFEAAGGVGGDGRSRYYVVFVEFDSEQPITEEEKTEFDRSLRRCNDNYDLFRSDDSISQMLVLQVHVGSLEGLKRLTIERNPDTTEAQYKTPTVLKTEQLVKDMLPCVLPGQLKE